MKTIETNKLKALMAHLDCDIEEARLWIADEDYLVYTDEEADEACSEYIIESLWAFNSCFLANCTKLPEVIFESLSKLCEDANEPIKKLIELTCGMDYIVNKACQKDGRGHFLATYDSEEIEETIDGITYYIYRRN